MEDQKKQSRLRRGEEGGGRRRLDLKTTGWGGGQPPLHVKEYALRLTFCQRRFCALR